MIRIALFTVICSVFPSSISLLADTLVLKNGTAVQGTFTGGSISAITFESNGSAKTYAVGDILSLTFQRTAPAKPPAEARPATQTSKPVDQGQTPAGPVTVNAGTRLMIRTQSSVQTGKSKTGDRFTATLEADLVVGGAVIAPRGSTVYGRVVEAFKARRVVGRAKLILELTDLMVNNQRYPLVSDQFGYEGERAGTLKKIVVGAAGGGVIGGSDGAEKGAAVGAGVAMLTKGRQIEIPAQSILEFRTLQPVTIQVR
jgi:hypothetical protein